jgi:hypothetical protein
MRPSLRWRLAACALLVGSIVAGCTTSTADNPTSAVPSGTASPSVVDTSSASPASSVPASPSPSVIDVSTPPTSPTTLDPEAQEIADRAAVEAAWVKFWSVYDGLIRIPPAERDAAAASVAVDPTLSQMIDDATTFAAQGIDFYGSSTFHPYWEQSINGAATAVMGDCTDTSSSGSVNTVSGQTLTVGVPKNNTRATFVRDEQGVWRVSEIFYLSGLEC